MGTLQTWSWFLICLSDSFGPWGCASNNEAKANLLYASLFLSQAIVQNPASGNASDGCSDDVVIYERLDEHLDENLSGIQESDPKLTQAMDWHLWKMEDHKAAVPFTTWGAVYMPCLIPPEASLIQSHQWCSQGSLFWHSICGTIDSRPFFFVSFLMVVLDVSLSWHVGTYWLKQAITVATLKLSLRLHISTSQNCFCPSTLRFWWKQGINCFSFKRHTSALIWWCDLVAHKHIYSHQPSSNTHTPHSANQHGLVSHKSIFSCGSSSPLMLLGNSLAQRFQRAFLQCSDHCFSMTMTPSRRRHHSSFWKGFKPSLITCPLPLWNWCLRSMHQVSPWALQPLAKSRQTPNAPQNPYEDPLLSLFVNFYRSR